MVRNSVFFTIVYLVPSGIHCLKWRLISSKIPSVENPTQTSLRKNKPKKLITLLVHVTAKSKPQVMLSGTCFFPFFTFLSAVFGFMLRQDFFRWRPLIQQTQFFSSDWAQLKSGSVSPPALFSSFSIALAVLDLYLLQINFRNCFLISPK